MKGNKIMGPNRPLGLMKVRIKREIKKVELKSLLGRLTLKIKPKKKRGNRNKGK
jgi:hypothetical protein